LGAAGVLALTLGPDPARKWVAPDEYRQMANPGDAHAASVETGGLFMENCATCHGAAGAGDGPGSRVLEGPHAEHGRCGLGRRQTDGEWFYKIATGKDPMIGYEDFLEDVEIWHLVNFVRDLSEREA
jgi:mono/diheme cytochrome c family protein